MGLVKFARSEDLEPHNVALQEAQALADRLRSDITGLTTEISATQERMTDFYASGDLGKHEAASDALRRHGDDLTSATAALEGAEASVAEAQAALEQVEHDARQAAAGEHPAVDQGIRRRLRREVQELRAALGSGVFGSELGIMDALAKEFDYWRAALPPEYAFLKALETAIKYNEHKPKALAEYIKYWCAGNEGDEAFCKGVRMYGDPGVDSDILFDWLSA